MIWRCGKAAVPLRMLFKVYDRVLDASKEVQPFSTCGLLDQYFSGICHDENVDV